MSNKGATFEVSFLLPQNMPPDTVKSFCQEALEAMEKGANLTDSLEAEKFLTAELNQLNQRIIHYAG